jgi:ABC-2 type transport system permease protein
MRKYLSLVKGSFMAGTTYIYGVLFTFVSNIAFIAVIYFLWKQIYGDAETLNGMTFNEVFVYLALGSTTINLFRTWTEWDMSYQIREGIIVADLIKPVDYQLRMFAGSLGFVLVNGLIIWVPSFIVVFGIFGADIPVNINLLFFPLSVVLAYILSFTIDYSVGLTSFYTESLWGLSTSKDFMVTLLSGALIPLPFFPDSVQRVLEVLPFQAIYNVPLQIATSPDLELLDYVQLIGLQLFWVMILVGISRLFYAQAIKVLTINGG